MTATAISLVLFGCVSDPIRPVAEDWDVLDKKPQTSWFDSKKSPLVMSAEKEVIDVYIVPMANKDDRAKAVIKIRDGRRYKMACEEY